MKKQNIDINDIMKQDECKVNDGVQNEDMNRFIDSEQILDRLNNGN